MKMFRSFILLSFFMVTMVSSYAQDNQVILNYINTYKELAIAEMQRTGVPASIKLAQGIHETMAGTSMLVMKSNNHFGIKCKNTWTGESVSHDDDARGECFRKYQAATDSYRDHSNFLKNSPRYASLFQLDPTDYAGWATGLKRAGYATNPRYPSIIIKLIEDYQLQDYTLIAIGKMPAGDIGFAKKEDSKAIAPSEVAVTTTVAPEPVAAPVNYPQGEFRINETRVVYVNKGVSYLSIAQQYNVPLGRIFEFNEMKPQEATMMDQLVYLQRKRRTGDADFHVVKAGESLWEIAQKQAIRLESLQELNWLRGDMHPAVGEKLALRDKATAMPKLALKDNYSITPTDRRWSTN